jgi:hypothetical protein
MQVPPANAYRLLTTTSLTSASETARALTPTSLRPTRRILVIGDGVIAVSVRVRLPVLRIEGRRDVSVGQTKDMEFDLCEGTRARR